jgi:hypothetical protein
MKLIDKFAPAIAIALFILYIILYIALEMLESGR